MMAKNIQRYGKPIYWILFLTVILFYHIDNKLYSQDSLPVKEADSCLVTIGLSAVDICHHSFSFPARVNMTRGLIEVVLSTPLGKTHESLLVTDLDPVSFQAALLLIGCQQTPAYQAYNETPEKIAQLHHEKDKPDQVEIYVAFSDSVGMKVCQVEEWIWDKERETVLHPVFWHFKGLPVDNKGNPFPYMGDNLVVSFMDSNSVLELDSPRLFNDNYFFVHESIPGFRQNREVTVTIKRKDLH